MNAPIHSEGRSVVLGASGFVGSRLARGLKRSGRSVVGFSRERPCLAEETFDDYIAGDFANVDDLRAAIMSGDTVYHCVGSADPRQSDRDAWEGLKGQIAANLGLFQIAIEVGVASLVFASSGGTVYGPGATIPTSEDYPLRPISPYGATKAAIELFAGSYRQMHGLNVRVARIANPFGPGQLPGRGQGFVASCLAASLRGGPIRIWGDGSITRDFVFIDDVVEGMIELARYDGSEFVFNIGSGRGRTIGRVAEDILACCGQGGSIEYSPAAAVDVPASILDITRAREKLGWQPRVGWQEGLEQTRAWLTEQSSG